MALPVMASQHSPLLFGLCIALGAVGGAGASAALGWSHHEAAAAPPRDTARAEGSPADDPRVGLLERRLAQLENAQSGRPEVVVTAMPDPAPQAAAHPTELAGSEEASRAQYQAEVTSFGGDPRDDRWAPGQEKVLGDGLHAIAAPVAFDVTGIECRTTWCRADLGFASYEAARQDLTSLLLGGHRGGCTVSIDLPTPEDPAKPYAAAAVYDCQPQRAP